MRFCLPDDDFGNKMRDLFSWYGIPVKQVCMPEGDQRSTGLKKTTQIITDIFEEPPAATGPVLFSKMRHFMDAQTLDINEGPKHGNLMERYFYPTWAAKYWLNHYLRLTKQRHKLPGMEQNDSVDKLPKMRDVERMAIIHVRLDAKSGVGRVMDETTLKHVGSSIAKANKRVSEWNNLSSSSKGKYFMPAERFSHIILYGDFDYFGGLKRKAWVEKELNDPNVAVLFISRPWEGKDRTAESPPVRSVGAEDRERINNEVEELWSKFRSIGFDYVPAQVKILSIWTALCKRYNPRACVIGHRSGFIEAAGLIGLPTLYLNDEREKVDREGNKKPGELLWAPFQSTSRLRMLSDVMNTIIPVEALQKQSKTRGSTTGEVKTLKIAPGYEDELTAALFMFMCCNIDTSSGRRYKGYPAWTARVAMRKSVSGRAWLCERYRFATGTSKDCGRKAWDEKDFDPWLRDIGKVWDYEWELRRLGVLPYNLGDDTHY
ncbi:hypothetical protein BFJ72_g3166 [Fusarium proliferatum]|uniref:Uncharacterized protein n=1 Tax=Gibberella intermedia TaxID=948311 RepID=A0A420TVJ8_GIBIN|nr:hypothetical protein BFJ72_g3166 [Fusarium proliferatum]